MSCISLKKLNVLKIKFWWLYFITKCLCFLLCWWVSKSSFYIISNVHLYRWLESSVESSTRKKNVQSDRSSWLLLAMRKINKSLKSVCLAEDWRQILHILSFWSQQEKYGGSHLHVWSCPVEHLHYLESRVLPLS